MGGVASIGGLDWKYKAISPEIAEHIGWWSAVESFALGG
jgi:hypothetical protein